LGNYNPPTFDRWFQRTFGRHTGTLMATPEQVGKQRKTFMDAIGRKTKLIERLGMDPEMVKAVDASTGEFLHPELIDELAAKLHDPFQKARFPEKMRTPVNNAAKNLYKTNTEVVNAPTNGTQRQYMREAMIMVRDNLRAQGIMVDTADVQALLWYAEKDLYVKRGARPVRGDADFASTFKELADAYELAR